MKHKNSENQELLFKMIQGQIGYNFKNPDLLRQACTRRSFSEENGGENNEVLEFIGDKALDFAVVKLLTQKFGKMAKGDPYSFESLVLHPETPDANEFLCEHDEGWLTKTKSRMVEKKNLARRIDELGFGQALIMGKSDIKNEVGNETSVKEDLFEAILGAVTLDCKWDFSVIVSVAEAMLAPEIFFCGEDTNYVQIIQDWEMKENGVIPWFRFTERSYSTWNKNPNTIYQNLPFEYNYSRIKYYCELKLLNDLPVFCGFGASKSEARMNVCQLAYEYLIKHGYIQHITIRDEIDEPSKEKAIGQLEILARRGYFSIPIYEFDVKYDENGNPIWTCECHIEEKDNHFSSIASSKKEAKKEAALQMLEYILETDSE